eukprot:5131768-Amphidinium_carterae.2
MLVPGSTRFNHAEARELPFIDELLAMGWTRLSSPSVPTCYHAGAESCIDIIALCSHRLLPALRSVRVTEDLAVTSHRPIEIELVDSHVRLPTLLIGHRPHQRLQSSSGRRLLVS